MIEFLTTVGNILLFIMILGLVICIHELGHFIFARKAGILCHEFSFGMGPRLFSKKFGETTFSIRALPFGGYVSMAGEELESEVVKVGDKIRLGFDEKQLVNRIVTNVANPKYLDFLEVTITDVDLKGISATGLHINEFPVKTNAFYVLDKQTLQIAPHNRNFNFKNKRQRFMTTFAGPLMNFVLAFFVFLLSAFIYGVADFDSTTINAVSIPYADNVPIESQLQADDTIVSINGVAISAWRSTDANVASVNSEFAKYADYDTFTIVVQRNGELITLAPVAPQYLFYGLGFASVRGSSVLEIGAILHNQSNLQMGDLLVSIDTNPDDDIAAVSFTSWDEVIAFAKAETSGSINATIIVDRPDDLNAEVITYTRTTLEGCKIFGETALSAMNVEAFYSQVGISGSTKFSFFGSFEAALISLKNGSLSIYRTLWALMSTNQVTINDLSGVVGIYTITADAASQGFQTLLGWIGLLSVNLGIVNLLPIPALDGGRLFMLGYEVIARKKPNPKVENWLNTIVFVLLLGLMVFITYKDILRLFQ
ncbi:MAG: site-2 protease family protein [Candidatus Izemoplasmatales bacterium]|jgi:regulator of sigma E protease|nr:site-2 protease family protein [Candidatus Izemoplasmatales bacterium]MDD3865715.1 site-2 protease family protein [Candidatus Izemoplasmatales bacterium]